MREDEKHATIISSNRDLWWWMCIGIIILRITLGWRKNGKLLSARPDQMEDKGSGQWTQTRRRKEIRKKRSSHWWSACIAISVTAWKMISVLSALSWQNMPVLGAINARLWKTRHSAPTARFTAISRKCGKGSGRSCVSPAHGWFFIIQSWQFSMWSVPDGKHIGSQSNKSDKYLRTWYEINFTKTHLTNNDVIIIL